MATVKNLLNTKGIEVWTVPITATVKETLKLLAEKNIGAVLVLEDEKIVGIFSERDYARHAAQNESMLLDELVSGLMTRSVYYVSPQQTVDECMALMTSKHIRHLPVLEAEQKLVGLISIGDVVRQLLEEKETTIQGLENYILGREYSG
jgi:CBS domain-containing protein